MYKNTFKIHIRIKLKNILLSGYWLKIDICVLLYEIKRYKTHV